jgi:hypothetical protein
LAHVPGGTRSTSLSTIPTIFGSNRALRIVASFGDDFGQIQDLAVIIEDVTPGDRSRSTAIESTSSS